MLAAKIFAVWLVIIAVEFVHGIVRTLLIVPHLGDFPARQVGVFTGSILILLIAYLFVPWIGAENTSTLILAGLVWLLLTVGFELGFGRLVLGRSWESLRSDYNLFRGGLLPLGLLVLSSSPLIATALRRRKKSLTKTVDASALKN